MKQKHNKTVQEKEAIIAEYLKGNISYRELGEKHGIDFRIVHSWVSAIIGNPLKSTPTLSLPPAKEGTLLPTEVTKLQEELRKTKLYNEVLNAMIDIAEGQFKIDIRKKSGTKR